MSKQNEFDTKAIELTHNDLESVVGGSANARNAAQANNVMATQQVMQNMQTSLNDAMNDAIKNIGGSIKSASQ
jgi:hypothetical protein